MNLFEITGKTTNEELTTVLAKGENIRVERIISAGETSPSGFWYDQNEDEFVVLLQGNARIEFEDGEKTLNAGDVLFIPAHQRHRVSYTDSDPYTVWLCIFGKEMNAI